MKKIILAIIGSILLTSCTSFFEPPPSAWELYYKKKEGDVPLEQIKKDMLNCGFDNHYNNYDMLHRDRNAYAIAVLCMENKGYRQSGGLHMGVCNHENYKNQRACQKQNNH